MEKKFNIKVNSFRFSIPQEEINALDLQALSTTNYHVLKDAQSREVEILHEDFLEKTYEILVNSNLYQVKISNQLDTLIKKMGLLVGTEKKMNMILAPMPGIILDVHVKEDDSVKEGDYLVVLEAMKMENTLTAPHDGIVKAVNIKAGETVNKNQLLIEME